MNAKMKVLALALLGLAGYAGSAAASCPSSPVPPWTAVVALGGTTAIVAPGYAASACHLDAAITGDASAFATVEDDTPTSEPRYRAQFIIKANNLTNLGLVAATYVFTATSASGGDPPVALSIIGDGAGGILLSYNVATSTGPVTDSVALDPVNENHVEFDYDNGSAAGSPGPHFSLWINNNVEASPDKTFTIASTSVVDTAFLGLSGPTPDYLTSFTGTTVGFDQFDSRRSTFIGF
jgi:hypothetical protein